MLKDCRRDSGAETIDLQEQDGSNRSVPVDHRMKSKYEELALTVKGAVEKKEGDTTYHNPVQGENEVVPSSTILWYAIAGGPGSGKSSLAKMVAKICQQKWKIPCIVISTDGYLISRADLSEKLGLDEWGILDFLRRRGSPHTIDAEQLCRDLFVASGKPQTLQNNRCHGVFADYSTANETNEVEPTNASAFSFPIFCRRAPSDPIEHQIQFDPSVHKVVFVEGKFLLLGQGGMIPGYVTETESDRWKPLMDIFDSTWFVTCQNQQMHQRKDEGSATVGEEDGGAWFDYDFEEQRKRRLRYHLEEVEEDEETIQLLFPSFLPDQARLTDEDIAQKRVESNDVLNMLIAETTKQHASVIIQSL